MGRKIHTLDDGHDGALLDGRRTLETVGVDSTEELSLEVHRIEGVGGLIVVGLDLTCAREMSVWCTMCGVCARALFVWLRLFFSLLCPPSLLSTRPQASLAATVSRKGKAVSDLCADLPASISSSPLSAMIAVRLQRLTRDAQ